MFDRFKKKSWQSEFEEAMARIVQVAELTPLLAKMSSPPNRRDQPGADDIEGRFDFWFDGGACQLVTGCSRYVFDNGAEAFQEVSAGLKVHVKFADGRYVKIEQSE